MGRRLPRLQAQYRRMMTSRAQAKGEQQPKVQNLLVGKLKIFGLRRLRHLPTADRKFRQRRRSLRVSLLPPKIQNPLLA
ncbi:hypothetical protein CAEBREN_11618 [Caenorhabditis brenneri]|uniref:Uncharacterized protein n=1 Tax=Caenorhabditis brenneri TaxID=135651 RepID=G0PGN6_CAEBE|nr:hypothetical protein CAEBREN_11618 [Caenorhabditis brenneri]